MNLQKQMITRIYVLESIPSDEIQTGTELYDDTIKRYCEHYANDLLHSLKTVSTKQELFDELNAIENEVSSDDEIVLHVEAHGAVDCMQLSSGELVSWEEFEHRLVPINLKTRNKLHINIVTCYGMHVAEKIGKGLAKTAPYKSFIASVHVLYPNQIISDNNLLYKEIIQRRDVYGAFVEFDKNSTDTTMRIKDVEYTLGIIMRIQIERFLSMSIDTTVMFYNTTYGLNIDVTKLNSFPTIEEKSSYVFELFGDGYFPDRPNFA